MTSQYNKEDDITTLIRTISGVEWPFTTGYIEKLKHAIETYSKKRVLEGKIDELKRCMLQSMASGELKHKFTRRIEQLEHELSLLGKEE